MAYEMRISDWSSDVCSSDLVPTLWREHWRAYKRTAPRWSACDTNQPRKVAPRRVLRPVHKPNRCSSQCRPRCLRPSALPGAKATWRSEEHTSELQSLMRISYAVFCLKKKTYILQSHTTYT